ncbi:hypothetical protein R8Z50_10765 [Longispora sp. K20-0274]|uniref:hypothetical protein n=1 Tax=Longispora sp. K20-0274 TaxID=3088255 RepID=UPI00399A65A7
MNTATKLGVFALGLALVFGAAYGAGHLTGPVTAAGTPAAGTHGGHGTATNTPAAELPGGLLVSERGYTLSRVAAADSEFAFQITGPDGKAFTAFDVAHDKRLHLVVARRDLSGFRHVHPQLGADGVWRVAVPFGEPGTYRAFADFKPTGADPLVLGLDVDVPGAFAPVPLPEPTTSATIDGYTVTMAGTVEPGRTSKLALTVTRDGTPVTDLEPYLGSYGHLVALRAGDLAYLHVHPETGTAGPQISFFAEVPTAGAYRLYLDFQHGGVVRTAEFTVTAGQPPAAPTGLVSSNAATSPGPGPTGHGH